MEGSLVKKGLVATFLLLVLYYGLQVGNVVALERTFEITTCGSRYELYVEASDTWQIGTQLEVKARLTLLQKRVGDSQVEYVTNASRPNSESLLVIVRGERLIYPEDIFYSRKDWWEFLNLTKDGDWCEVQLLLEMNKWNAGKLERGETIDATLDVLFTLDAFGANHTKIVESFSVCTLFLSDDDQIQVTVFRPSFTTTEIYTAVGVGGLIAFALTMFALNRLGWISFGFTNAFSKFSNKYPLLAHMGSSIILVVLWFFFIPALNGLFITFQEFFLLAFLFAGVFVVSSIILTVGLLEFILKDWKFLQISLEFLVAITFTCFLYLAIDYLIFPP